MRFIILGSLVVDSFLRMLWPSALPEGDQDAE